MVQRLVLILIIIGFALGGAYWSVQSGYIHQLPLPDQIKQPIVNSQLVKAESFDQLPTQFQSIISSTVSQSTQVAGQAQNVLGTYIEPTLAEDEQPLHQRAFEHGRYLYCQEVIKEYEQTSETAQ